MALERQHGVLARIEFGPVRFDLDLGIFLVVVLNEIDKILLVSFILRPLGQARAMSKPASKPILIIMWLKFLKREHIGSVNSFLIIRDVPDQTLTFGCLLPLPRAWDWLLRADARDL